MCDVKDRLDSCQAELTALGYKDVKFFYELSNKSLSQAATEAADVLEAILKNRCSDFQPFGDSTS